MLWFWKIFLLKYGKIKSNIKSSLKRIIAFFNLKLKKNKELTLKTYCTLTIHSIDFVPMRFSKHKTQTNLINFFFPTTNEAMKHCWSDCNNTYKNRTSPQKLQLLSCEHKISFSFYAQASSVSLSPSTIHSFSHSFNHSNNIASLNAQLDCSLKHIWKINTLTNDQRRRRGWREDSKELKNVVAAVCSFYLCTQLRIKHNLFMCMKKVLHVYL